MVEELSEAVGAVISTGVGGDSGAENEDVVTYSSRRVRLTGLTIRVKDV